MTKLSALALPLAALIVAALFTLTSVGIAEAQDRGGKPTKSSGKKIYRNQGVGGTSLTLSDIWGPAEMPPPPKDSPGYDYTNSGYTLNGAPNRSPYPN
jgi:hypothetical protein